MTAHILLYKRSLIFQLSIINQIGIIRTKRVLQRVKGIFAAFGAP